MQIPIPKWLVRRYRTIDNWLNSIAARPLQIEIRTIDILLALGFLVCVLLLGHRRLAAIIGGLPTS